MSDQDPPIADFASAAEVGRRYEDPAVQQRAAEISVWDSLSAAVQLAARKPALRYVAVLEIPMHIQLRPGRRGHWGIPKDTGAERIKGWIVEVLPLP